MLKRSIKRIFASFLFLLFYSSAYSEVINQIDIFGNNRISDQTVIMFSNINKGDDVDQEKLNNVLKNLYETNFFENVTVKVEKNVLTITVDEYPIINNINIIGVKAKKYKDMIVKNFTLKPKQSYNEFLLSEEIKSIKLLLKNLGFYFATVEPYLETTDNDMVNINYEIDIGDKAKIKKITFLGDKIYKDRKLRSIIVSEEYKIWKFISGKKIFK